MTDPRITEVLEFWRDAQAEWFAHDPQFDARFRTRFAMLHRAATAGELASWEDSAEGCLALLVLLDQYPRNAFRGSARMYATDAAALRIAHKAVARGDAARLAPPLLLFLFLPFSHSELLADQELSVALHRRWLPGAERHAEEHRAIIARFGRFPHRAALLGRDQTEQEAAYLRAGGFQG